MSKEILRIYLKTQIIDSLSKVLNNPVQFYVIFITGTVFMLYSFHFSLNSSHYEDYASDNQYTFYNMMENYDSDLTFSVNSLRYR